MRSYEPLSTLEFPDKPIRSTMAIVDPDDEVPPHARVSPSTHPDFSTFYTHEFPPAKHRYGVFHCYLSKQRFHFYPDDEVPPHSRLTTWYLCPLECFPINPSRLFNQLESWRFPSNPKPQVESPSLNLNVYLNLPLNLNLNLKLNLNLNLNSQQ